MCRCAWTMGDGSVVTRRARRGLGEVLGSKGGRQQAMPAGSWRRVRDGLVSCGLCLCFHILEVPITMCSV